MNIFDAHLDLAMNAVMGQRDLRQPAATWPRPAHWGGASVVSLPELRAGGVRWVVGTIFQRCRPELFGNGAGEIYPCDFPDATATAAAARGDLAWYELMASDGELRLVREAADLIIDEEAAASASRAIRCLLMLEGADPIRETAELETWVAAGLRMIALVHAGTNRYAGGNGSETPLTDAGRALLEAMNAQGVILDTSHLGERSFWQAMDHFPGPVCATHTNCRALVPGDRQFSDDQLRALFARGAVVGVALYNPFLLAGWTATDPDAAPVTWQHVVDHFDHLIQLAGNDRQVGLGSDLDGGFGRASTPASLQTAADLPQLAEALSGRGYADETIRRLLHENWLTFFQQALPGDAG